LEDKIFSINDALGNIREEVPISFLPIDTSQLDLDSYATNFGNTIYFIPKITLADVISLIEENGLINQNDKLVLKIDCEGCEYDVVPQMSELRRFDEVILEYHGNPYPLLEGLTKAGFYAEIIIPRMIYAKKLKASKDIKKK